MPDERADALILRIAGGQHGIIARWQLAAAGVSLMLVDGRVRRRRIERLSHGVYRVPGLAGPRADVVAAVLGAGPHALASHESAGHVHQMVAAPPPRFVVSAFRGHPVPRAGVLLHRVRLADDERTTCDGVPVTTPARTLLDLAGSLPNRALEQALARGLRDHQLTRETLLALLARYPGRPGATRMRAMLHADESPAMTRSEAEERFLDLVRTAQLPAPQVNVRIHGFEADFYWRAHQVVAEIDGLAYHTTRDAQRRDRQRDTTLGAAGIRVLRFTWHDLTSQPEVTLAKVAMALGRAAV